ncbi:tyrosine-type recombinase/integrase [Pseudophaeobacter flagellatus]|uniref:tyrosine-type recombinase/integrase n=1 Tax=Pseudophaeobacter flagellatus TaxID=2899119 RepID=UPI001E4D2A70|nr:tyrosine-type recombinase/integrase [Pseudophaeobacter flagellatus]MCD9149985.1 tyrosine-type recombinase/integrase [Pseudophaeobacter flagellatus]
MRRQRKPNVAMKNGRLYYRIRWAEGAKRRERYIPLPPDEDSAEFDRAYWAIRSGRSPAVAKPAAHSWQRLIVSYRGSSKFQKLADGTKRKYHPVLDALLEKNSSKCITKTSRAAVRAIHEKMGDTPRKADLYVQLIRRLYNFASNDLDWDVKNPAEGIELYGPKREFEPWPEDAQLAYIEAANDLDDETALTAFFLGTGTGQRPGDLCSMKWEHFDGESISVIQDKTDVRIWIYCPQRLRKHLSEIPRRGAYILAKNLTMPVGYDAIEKRFRKVRTAAGAICNGLVMHGWRYTAAVELAEAGCSDAEIQSVTGHKTLAMVQKYRQRASQRRLSKQAQSRRDRT